MRREDEIELPASVMALLESADQAREDERAAQMDRLDELAKFFATQRKEAVDARSASGIEGVWLTCEEAYAGIDDANRHEFAGSSWTKPMTVDGPVSTDRKIPESEQPRSSAFLMLTMRYVDAAAAKTSDIMLPQDDQPFTFAPTPVPDLVRAREDRRQVVDNGVPLQRDATPAEAMAMAGQQPQPNELAPATDPAEPTSPPPPPPGQGPGVPLTVADLAEEQMDQATEAAKKAEKIILDWLVEGNFTREMRAVDHDAARLGVGILKGPYPKITREMAVSSEMGADGLPVWTVTMREKLVRAFTRVDPWNFYPAKGCGEDIHNGDHVFERDLFSKSQLRALLRTPGYIREQVEAALEEGPGGRHGGRQAHGGEDRKNQYEVWTRYGAIAAEDMATIDCCAERERERGADESAEVHAILMMVNDRIIRAVPNPLHSGALPYHVKPWRRRAGHWAGKGVAEQISMAQRGANGAVRALFDNAGYSAGVQIIYDPGAVVPADRTVALSPIKIWLKRSDSPITDVRMALAAVTIPSLQPQLMAIIQQCEKWAEDSSSVPLISQGMSGYTTPETLGATQLQDNNANQLLRDQAHDFDQLIKLPFLRQCYEYLLLDPDVPNDAKGDFQIHISSAVALVEKALHDQFIMQLFPQVQQAANPYRVDPAKLFALLAKSKRLNPKEIQYTDEEWQKITSAPPPKDVKVQVAEVQAQATLQRAQLDTDRDRAYVQAETERTQAERAMRERELALKLQLAQLEYANRQQISLDQLKAELAQTTMKLHVQQQLAAQDHAGEALTPPTEPPGRAPDGQSYER